MNKKEVKELIEQKKIRRFGLKFNNATRDKMALKGLRVEDILKELE